MKGGGEAEITDDVVDDGRSDGVNDVDRQLQDKDCKQQGRHRCEKWSIYDEKEMLNSRKLEMVQPCEFGEQAKENPLP